ncbi:polysaccharide deacetylase family protein [Alteromonas sp. CYL-A6]|uniref:polysaccharide deacetylase family protein n=1 Tax=Alteromonas nitratireducens TaxID=3390813 RepID=UPI0034BDBDB8
MKVLSLTKRLLCEAGLTDVLWSLRPNGLYCFNFHRIGDSQSTDFDPCVFSCNKDDLRQYLTFINANFEVIDIPALHTLIESGKAPDKRYALITFDDGYRDNFDNAFPVLQELGLSAAFFITTSLIGSAQLPWWDEIAWYVKHLKGRTLDLPGFDVPITIPEKITPDVIKSVLSRVKRHSTDFDALLTALKETSGGQVPSLSSKQNLFMTWEHLRALLDGGMSIGAHSHSHRILSFLSMKELEFELSHSKHILDSELNTEINTLSYPVGSAHTYNEMVLLTAKRLGYRSAFSFGSKINVNIADNHMELGRFSIDRPFDEAWFKKLCLTSG